MIIAGHHFHSALLERIQAHAGTTRSRSELARCVCQWLDWRTVRGQWQEGGCRKALTRLARLGLIQLPNTSHHQPKRQCVALDHPVPNLHCELDELGTISLVRVDDSTSEQAKLWRGMIEAHHYLGDKKFSGATMRYLVQSSQHGWLGALAFCSASWALASRDDYIGWSEDARAYNLSQVVRNARFLILPGVQVPNLASHVLGLATKTLPADWFERYGARPVLLETFVNPNCFKGSCYKAANWIMVGSSAGRRDGVAKHIYLQPLTPQWREVLCTEPPLRLGPTARDTQTWSEKEFSTLRVQDKRLKERLISLANDFYNCSQGSIPQACASRAGTVGAYRFFQNKKVSMDKILLPHLEATIERIREHPVVLAPQDTSTLNYYHHPATTGLGPVSTEASKATGLLLHDTLAFTPQGLPLGVVDAQCWAREPAKKGQASKKLSIEAKESMKWLRSYDKLCEIQAHCPETLLVSIGDRESDIYDLFARAQANPQGPRLLIRANKGVRRRIEQGELWEHVPSLPPQGKLHLRLPRRGNQAARDAELNVRYAAVELQPPGRSLHPSIGCWAVHLKEKHRDGNQEPLEWLLLTTVAVNSLEDAIERSQWYSRRWGIEVFHRTLKSGCRIKDRQLGTAQGLKACLGIDMVVAWRIFHLTMLGREVPNQPCSVFFEEAEWKALHYYHYKTREIPDTPPSLSEAIRMIAKMGGHQGRKGDGAPGTQVLWRGIQKLESAVDMFVIFTNLPGPTSRREYPQEHHPPSTAPPD